MDSSFQFQQLVCTNTIYQETKQEIQEEGSQRVQNLRRKLTRQEKQDLKLSTTQIFTMMTVHYYEVLQLLNEPGQKEEIELIRQCMELTDVFDDAMDKANINRMEDHEVYMINFSAKMLRFHSKQISNKTISIFRISQTQGFLKSLKLLQSKIRSEFMVLAEFMEIPIVAQSQLSLKSGQRRSFKRSVEEIINSTNKKFCEMLLKLSSQAKQFKRGQFSELIKICRHVIKCLRDQFEAILKSGKQMQKIEAEIFNFCAQLLKNQCENISFCSSHEIRMQQLTEFLNSMKVYFIHLVKKIYEISDQQLMASEFQTNLKLYGQESFQFRHYYDKNSSQGSEQKVSLEQRKRLSPRKIRQFVVNEDQQEQGKKDQRQEQEQEQEKNEPKERSQRQ